MAHETIDGTYRQTNLRGESAEYLAPGARSCAAPKSTCGTSAKVAELRRRLPPGPVVQDYELLEGPAWLNAFGVAHHLAQNIDVAVAAAAEYS